MNSEYSTAVLRDRKVKRQTLQALTQCISRNFQFFSEENR